MHTLRSSVYRPSSKKVNFLLLNLSILSLNSAFTFKRSVLSCLSSSSVLSMVVSVVSTPFKCCVKILHLRTYVVSNLILKFLDFVFIGSLEFFF